MRIWCPHVFTFHFLLSTHGCTFIWDALNCEAEAVNMRKIYLTIALAIGVPFLLVLFFVLFLYLVIKKCVLGKRELPETDLEDDSDHCRLDQVEPSLSTDPVGLNTHGTSYNHTQHLVPNSATTAFSQLALQLPRYSTLPRNTTRGLSPNSSSRPRDDESGGNGRFGYRLASENFSPFTHDISNINSPCRHSEAMRAVALCCDRYIDDAFYEPPPPYNSRETLENTDLRRSISGEDPRLQPSTYGLETWIWIKTLSCLKTW